MMQIARFRIEHEGEDMEVQPGSTREDQIWEFLLKNIYQWEDKDIKPLYLTHRGVYGGISLVVSSKSADAFAEFILNNVPTLDFIKDVWMFNMMEPRLFSIPTNLSQNMKRFTLTLNVVPKEAPFIYDFISKINPSSEIVITYITYTYHRRGDILISLLANDQAIVEDFVRNYLDGMKGVVETDIIPIVKSKNLATPKEWRDNCGQYFSVKDGKDLKDLEIYEIWSNVGFE